MGNDPKNMINKKLCQTKIMLPEESTVPKFNPANEIDQTMKNLTNPKYRLQDKETAGKPTRTEEQDASAAQKK